MFIVSLLVTGEVLVPEEYNGEATTHLLRSCFNLPFF